MRRYETIIIIDPDLSEDDRTSLLTRVKEIIPQQEGILIQEDLWGVKKLAYPIRKKPRGFYARMDYCGMGQVVNELERFFGIDDRVMKYLTVQLDAEADVEKIQAEVTAAKEAVAQSAQAAEDKTPADESETAQASEPVQETVAEPEKAEETNPEN